jgi:hypothetical protein
MAIDERRTLTDDEITTTSVRTAARPGSGVRAAMKDSDGTDTGDADGTDKADSDGTDRADKGDQTDKADSDGTDRADRA